MFTENEFVNNLNEKMFEFSHVVWALAARGWVLGEIKYGNHRLDIGPSMRISKGYEQ